MPDHPSRRALFKSIAAAGALAAASGVALAQSGEPIKIGFSMAITGGLGPIGKPVLVSMQIWEQDINAKGGLLGRPVKLVYYDDQSNPSTVPGIYTKLINVDKVDVILGGYATNMLAPALPVVMQKKKTMIGLFGIGVNTKFKYDRYFAFIPSGHDPKVALSRPYFAALEKLEQKPKSIAIVAADAEFAQNAAEGARANAKAAGMNIVYDKSYPPSTVDFAPIIRAIQATNPDAVFVGSYPPDSVGMVQAAAELGLKTHAFGGGMVGLQATGLKAKLGPALNGIMNYEFWVPAPKLLNEQAKEFLKKYQAKAAAEGVDPLGYYEGPFAYSYIDVLGQAITATKSLDDAKLAQYLHATTFKTMIGDVKFGPDGEWEKDRMLLVQYSGIKGNDVEQFRDLKSEKLLWPTDMKTGDPQDFNALRK